MPQLYVIAGPNGVGKTTFAKEFLPSHAKCPTFVNADLIAQGLAPFSPSTVALKAGKLLIERIRELAQRKADFAFETTLSGRSYLSLLRGMKEQGYRIHIFFLWIQTVELALARIANRVRMGGHAIPADTVHRRFHRGLENFLHRYQPMADSWYLFDNSGIPPVLVAKEERGSCSVLNEDLYARITKG